MSTDIINKIQPVNYTERDQDISIIGINEADNDGDMYMYAYNKLSDDHLPIDIDNYNTYGHPDHQDVDVDVAVDIDDLVDNSYMNTSRESQNLITSEEVNNHILI